ncbi:unnamed protein product [Rotaria sordida]|uniref:Uncharacterized protein n=1 Tax=Rotaria sordida TaxID=392033 RepID=A0A819NJP3_9BILA|nr:unnamed protein product [Rotaria sordida]
MLHTFFFVIFLVSSSNTLPLSDFFPFGSEKDDSIISPDNINIGPLDLPYVFPCFDNNYNQIWINSNGLFSFRPPINYYSPRPLTSLNDSCLVAGFWHAYIWNQDNDTENGVYYQIHSNISISNFTVTAFNKASDYVRKFFPQQRPFKPKMVITSTWYYIGINHNATNTLNNTFQIILCTDEDRSFVFFLYHDLQWSNPYNMPYNYAEAGIHNGNQNKSQILPYSGKEHIVKLVNESNVNVPGLFVFRIDADEVNAGGCNTNVTIISFRPRISSQLGSTALNIYGPCFTNQTKVKCQFSSSLQPIDGFIIDEFRASCLTPFTSVHGSVPVNISIDNGTTFVSAGTFTYAPVQFNSDEVIIQTEGNDYNLLSAGQYVRLTWYFSEVMRNTFPNGTKIDIELWKVSLNVRSQLQKDNTPIILVRNGILTNSVRVQLPSSISNISTCYIRVIAHFNAQIYVGLNTGLLIVRSPSSLALELCQNWAARQPDPSTWNGDVLLQCPMTRWQAIAAGRCCYELDRQCYNGNSNSNNCWLHKARPEHDEPSAIECYISKYSNNHHAGAECCYDNNHMLITRGTGAGTDDRYHQIISPVQHFFHDTLPYLQCCMMNTSNEACNRYMYYRPPRRGSNTMGDSGRMWGDPHFGTLDGTPYTFNGYGEYIYLAISNSTSPSAAFNVSSQSYIFMSQIRTVPISSSNATVTKGFAARSNNIESETVKVTISRRERLVLHRGNEPLEFDDNMNIIFFPEITISRLDGNNNRHFSLSWTIGVTIEINVIEMISPSKQLVLNIGTSIAGIFREKTYGLLGTYDGRTDNDLRSRNGSIIRSNASIEQIHKDFGVTWAIDPFSSLLYYESDQTSELFYERNREFIPSFIDPTTTTNNLTIRTNCNINATSSAASLNLAQRTCYYDLYMTNDINFAKESLRAGNELLEIRKNQRNPPLFKSSLPLSMNLTHGQQMNLNVSATSEYPSHIVELFELHLPTNATFDRNTSIFLWIAIKGEHYLSIEARDKTYNLTSKHDITFYVKANDPIVVTPSSGSNSLVKKTTFIIIILGLTLLFGR